MKTVFESIFNEIATKYQGQKRYQNDCYFIFNLISNENIDESQKIRALQARIDKINTSPTFANRQLKFLPQNKLKIDLENALEDYINAANENRITNDEQWAVDSEKRTGFTSAITYAVAKYTPGRKKRSQDIDAIANILNEDITDQEKFLKIQTVLLNLKTGFFGRSRLRDQVNAALEMYEPQPEQTDTEHTQDQNTELHQKIAELEIALEEQANEYNDRVTSLQKDFNDALEMALKKEKSKFRSEKASKRKDLGEQLAKFSNYAEIYQTFCKQAKNNIVELKKIIQKHVAAIIEAEQTALQNKLEGKAFQPEGPDSPTPEILLHSLMQAVDDWRAGVISDAANPEAATKSTKNTAPKKQQPKARKNSDMFAEISTTLQESHSKTDAATNPVVSKNPDTTEEMSAQSATMTH